MTSICSFILKILISTDLASACEAPSTAADHFFPLLPRELQEHVYSYLTMKDLSSACKADKLHEDLACRQLTKLSGRLPQQGASISYRLTLSEMTPPKSYPWHILKPGLEHVEFTHLSYLTMEAALRHFASYNNLHSLCFNGDALTRSPSEPCEILDTAFIGRGVNSLPHIKTLTIENYDLSDTDLSPIIPTIAKLEELFLTFSNLQDKNIEPVIAALSPNLKNLYIGNNPIGDQTITALVKKFPSLTQLHGLDISLANVSSRSLVSLQTHFPSSIKTLTLNSSGIADQGILLKDYNTQISHNPGLLKFVFIFGFLQNTELEELHLDDNDITSRGITNLIREISYMQTKPLWKLLNLNGNMKINDSAIPALKMAILHLPHLKDLYLQHTSLSQKAVKKLQQENKKNLTIHFN